MLVVYAAHRAAGAPGDVIQRGFPPSSADNTREVCSSDGGGPGAPGAECPRGRRPLAAPESPLGRALTLRDPQRLFPSRLLLALRLISSSCGAPQGTSVMESWERQLINSENIQALTGLSDHFNCHL